MHQFTNTFNIFNHQACAAAINFRSNHKHPCKSPELVRTLTLSTLQTALVQSKSMIGRVHGSYSVLKGYKTLSSIQQGWKLIKISASSDFRSLWLSYINKNFVFVRHVSRNCVNYFLMSSIFYWFNHFIVFSR